MKRKRGPAPHVKKNRLKPRIEERDSDEKSEESDVVGEEDSFEGFSTDEEEENGEAAIEADGSNANIVNGSTGPTKKRGKKSALTQEELMELVLRSSSFQSNLFKLQVDELLSEVRVKYDKMAKVETILHKLKGILMGLPGGEEKLLHAFELEMKNDHHIRVPFPTPAPPNDALYKFKFQTPTSIKLVGAYGLKAAAKHPNGITIDVSVQMPDSTFQDKDYIDHRYLYKRACYLASLAAGIKASDLPVSMAFDHLHGDDRRPVLVLSSLQDGSEHDFSKTHARIRLLPSISHDTFTPSKLLPTRCNVRKSTGTATPLYNAAILTDSTYLHFLTQLYTSSQSCSALLDASLLGKVWLRQRGFGGSYFNGGFGNFEWTWFISYLLRGGGPNGRHVLESGFSSFQLFRGALNSLAMKDRVEGENVVCLDVESGVNVFYKMTPTSYKLLQHEAARTLSMLENSHEDVFNAIFMIKVDNSLLWYDISARITIPYSEENNDADCPSHSFSYIKRTTAILQRALTTRATLISVRSSENPTISISTSKSPESITLTLGVLIDPESSRRLVDHGPPASDSTAALQFRSFWGDKAELRRFKDGSILESVVWTCKTTEDRYGIVKRIIRYVLARHISAGVAGDIQFLTPNLYPQIIAPPQVSASYIKADGDAFHLLNDAYEQFVRHLKDLKDVPLTISSVVPISEGLTHSSIYPPYPQNYTKLSRQSAGSYYIPIHEVVVQLEGSGKWPDDLRAIQKVKVGLLLHMARQLEKSHSVSANVGIENPQLDIANTGFLDVVYEHGYAFRVRIQQDPNHREATLIERTLKNKSLSKPDRTRYDTVLKLYRTTFIRHTTHAQALHALRDKYYFLPNTTRLVKRWLSSHLLCQQISPRAIELIVCYVFIHPHPWSSPASAEVGFLRTLKLLATWDWRKDPLIVDLDGSMTTARIEEAVKSFELFRKQDPGIANTAWSICTSYDSDGSCWTRERPGKTVAARVTALARSSLEVISQEGGNVKQIFTTPLTDYDFIINLKKDLITGTTTFKNLRGQAWKDVLVDFDPVRDLLKDLEACNIFWKILTVVMFRGCHSMVL